MLRLRNPMGMAVFLVFVTGTVVAGILVADMYASDPLSGPVYRFPLLPGETSLNDDRAVTIAQDVMKRDGFTESSWTMLHGDPSEPLKGRAEHFLSRDAKNTNRGHIYFDFAGSPRRGRFVFIELHDGEITAQGTLGK
jgi:hypothetical protein